MAAQRVQNASGSVWKLVRNQHFAVSRGQLLEFGLTHAAIRHRVASGRLHPVHAGVYAVGRRELPRLGELMAAVLACGPGAVLCRRSAAELWELGPLWRPIEVAVPPARRPHHRQIIVLRREIRDEHITSRRGIPVTTPARALVDMAPVSSDNRLERAVNEADRLDLVDPERLRTDLDTLAGVTGVAKLRGLLDRHTFTLTRSQLERRFKPIAKRAGLPGPLTQETVNGYEVDFFWADLGIVVETDGLRYHRTPAQQTAALLRDQTHQAADLEPLRFSHWQVAREQAHVEEMLRRAVVRCRRRLS